jgi:predicted ribosomally synthesized peptide with SipW-like signal peptide
MIPAKEKNNLFQPQVRFRNIFHTYEKEKFIMKKNVMTAVVSGAMVGCLAIGGTFAYLTANSGTVKNTFSGVEAIKTAVMETVKDGETYDVQHDGVTVENYTTEWLYEGNDGVKYINVVPGASIAKDVDVKVDQNETPVYLFVKVTGQSAAAVVNIGADWTAVNVDGVGNGIYVWKDYTAIDSSDAAVVKDVFDTISINSAATLDSIGEVEIDVAGAIVQANGGNTEADALTAAQELLG